MVRPMATSASTSPTWPRRRHRLAQVVATGSRPTTGSAGGCSICWASPVRCRRATSPTLPRCRGSRSGWTHDRNVTQMLEFLASRGEVAVAGRRGRQRLWDLAERVYPAGTRSYRPTRPAASATSGGCGRSASPARRSSAMPASRPRSRARPACGGSTPRRPPRASRDAPRCSRRSTGSSTTGSARRAVRLRVHAGDVQAEGQAALGLLRPPGAPPRPARRQGRRHRRPEGVALLCTPCTRTSASRGR